MSGQALLQARMHGRMAASCCQMWQEQRSAPLKLQRASGAAAADAPRAGQQPSGYASHWQCILIRMLKSLFDLKALA